MTKFPKIHGETAMTKRAGEEAKWLAMPAARRFAERIRAEASACRDAALQACEPRLGFGYERAVAHAARADALTWVVAKLERRKAQP